MATNTGGNPYSNTQQRPSHHISPFYKVVVAAVITLGLIFLLAKVLHSWLRSLKDAQEADAADSSGRRAPSDAEAERRLVRPAVMVDTAGIGSRDGGVVAPRQQPPAPATVGVEMVRSMGPLVCTYLMADGWPAEAACAVCLAKLADGEALRVLLVCMHYFHAACVGEWLRAHDTCPLCRTPLSPPAADDVTT